MRKPIPKPITYDDTTIEDLCEIVYRKALGEKDVASMIAKDKDTGEKLRRRAQGYAITVRLTLDALTKYQEPRA